MAHKKGHGNGKGPKGKRPWEKPAPNKQRQQKQYDYGDFTKAFQGFGGFSLKDEARETAWSTSAFTRSQLWKNKVVFVSGGNLNPSELMFPQHPTEDHGEAQALVNNPELPSLSLSAVASLSLEDKTTDALEPTTAVQPILPKPATPTKSERRSSSVSKQVQKIEESPNDDIVLFKGRQNRNAPKPKEHHSAQKPISKRARGHKKRQEEEASALADYLENIEKYADDTSDESIDTPLSSASQRDVSSKLGRQTSNGSKFLKEIHAETSDSPNMDSIKTNQLNTEADLARLLMNQQEVDDEAFARLLAKQEEIGLGTEELLLFDDTMAGMVGSEDDLSAGDFDVDDVDDDEDEDEDDDDELIHGFFSSAQQGKLIVPAREGEYPVASELAEMYEFDILDMSRPSLLVKQSKKKAAVETIIHDDPEIEAQMRRAWRTDREKKVARKLEKQREKELVKNNDESTMEVEKIITEIDGWLASGIESLKLPPMSNYDRKSIHVVAQKLSLKSKSTGPKSLRFTTLLRTQKTGNLDEMPNSMIGYLKSRGVKGRRSALGGPAIVKGGAKGGGWQRAKELSYRDGEVVGATAAEIGTDNLGRQMLEKMGWTKGTALGAENNKGRLMPVEHVVKVSRTGLGQ